MTKQDTATGVINLRPDLLKGLRAVEAAINASGLPRRLLELVRLRVSQINGCDFCTAMHGPIAAEDGFNGLHGVPRETSAAKAVDSITPECRSGIHQRLYRNPATTFFTVD